MVLVAAYAGVIAMGVTVVQLIRHDRKLLRYFKSYNKWIIKIAGKPGVPYALLLARTVRERFGATWGISETGAAGPTGNPYGDAAGHTCVAISGPVEFATTIETGSPDRLANMDAFAAAALDLLARATAE